MQTYLGMYMWTSVAREYNHPPQELKTQTPLSSQLLHIAICVISMAKTSELWHPTELRYCKTQKCWHCRKLPFHRVGASQRPPVVSQQTRHLMKMTRPPIKHTHTQRVLWESHNIGFSSNGHPTHPLPWHYKYTVRNAQREGHHKDTGQSKSEATASWTVTAFNVIRDGGTVELRKGRSARRKAETITCSSRLISSSINYKQPGLLKNH